MPTAETAPPHQDWSGNLASLRSRLLDQITLLVGLSLLVTHGHTIYEALQIAGRWSLPLAFGGTATLWLLFFLHHRLPYRLRARLLLTALWALVLASVASLGPIADVKGFFVLLTLTASLFLGPRAGWFNVCGVGLTLTAIGTASVQGWGTCHPDYDAYVRLPVTWLQDAFGGTVYAIISALIATRLLDWLTAAAQRLAEQTRASRAVETQLRRALLAAEAANQAKGQFLAIVSHELRTPLHAVLGFAEVLEASGICAGRQADLLAGISRNGRGLLHLVNEILELTRGETGRLPVQARPCALQPTLERAIALVQRQAQAKGLDLRLMLGPSVPDAILMDPVRLVQVLTNLLDNAVKFTARGYVALSAEARPLPGDAPGCALWLAVEDTGTGIAPQDHRRIFEPFEQAGGMADRRRGAGLGLCICAQLVAAMDGQIAVSSSPGHGSRFEVSFARVPILVGLPTDERPDGSDIEDRTTDHSGLVPPQAITPEPLDLSPALARLLLGRPAARWRALNPAADPTAVAAFTALIVRLARLYRSRSLADWATRLAQAGDGEDRQQRWAAFGDFLWELPPRAALVELRTLADLGLTSRIEDWCATWEAHDERHAAFVRTVLALAYTFDPTRLCALLDAFLERPAP